MHLQERSDVSTYAQTDFGTKLIKYLFLEKKVGITLHRFNFSFFSVVVFFNQYFGSLQFVFVNKKIEISVLLKIQEIVTFFFNSTKTPYSLMLLRLDFVHV